MVHRAGGERPITAAGLTRLLGRLDGDAERAAVEYERLRRALIRFFDWRGAWMPEECADETLDRLTRKLEDTAVDDVGNYARGIARLVLLERGRQPVPVSIDRDVDLSALPIPAMDEEEERLHECLDRCLTSLPSEARSLVLRYYEGTRRDKISNRRSLATALRVSENALRNRVQRLRDRLEECIEACVATKERVS